MAGLEEYRLSSDFPYNGSNPLDDLQDIPGDERGEDFLPLDFLEDLPEGMPNLGED